MVDYKYPLPLKSLKKRYYVIESAINKNQCALINGLPHSAKSGYLKHILEDTDLFSEIFHIDRKIVKTIYFSPISIDVSGEFNWLYQLNNLLMKEIKGYNPKFSIDPIIVQSQILKLLNILQKKKLKLHLILDNPDYWSELSKESTDIFLSLATYKKDPNLTPFTFTFLTEFLSLNINDLSTFFKEIFWLFENNISYFKVLNKKEAEYSIKRLSFINNYNITNRSYKCIYKLSGGIWPLLKDVTGIVNKDFNGDLAKCDDKIIEIILNNPQIQNTIKVKLNKFIENIKFNPSNNKEIGLTVDKNQLISSILVTYLTDQNPRLRITIDNLPGTLTSNEVIFINELYQSESNYLSKEKLAEILWEKNNEKFSVYAIDKFISRLRNKLKSANSKLKILTLPKRGYYLFINKN